MPYEQKVACFSHAVMVSWGALVPGFISSQALKGSSILVAHVPHIRNPQIGHSSRAGVPQQARLACACARHRRQITPLAVYNPPSNLAHPTDTSIRM